MNEQYQEDHLRHNTREKEEKYKHRLEDYNIEARVGKSEKIYVERQFAGNSSNHNQQHPNKLRNEMNFHYPSSQANQFSPPQPKFPKFPKKKNPNYYSSFNSAAHSFSQKIQKHGSRRKDLMTPF